MMPSKIPVIMGKIVKRSHHQTGRTHVPEDRRRPAMPPGIRKSAKGKKYGEYRRNRSDLRKKRGL